MRSVAGGASRSFRSALDELIEQGLELRRWWTLAWADTRFRYRRTTLGPLWLTLSMAATVLSVGFVFGTIFSNDLSAYFPHFAVGLVVWTFISQCILEACLVYVNSAGHIKSTTVPLLLHVYRLLARQLILLAHNLLLLIGVWLFCQWSIDLTVLLAFLGLLINIVALLGAMLACGIVCTRYRDMHQIISSLIALLFFLTPIIWLPGAARSSRIDAVLHGNPFYYLVEIVRQPLLGHVPDLQVWLIAVALATISILIGTAFHARYRYRVAYWL